MFETPTDEEIADRPEIQGLLVEAVEEQTLEAVLQRSREQRSDISTLLERTERIAQTISVIALTLVDFRERIVMLERPSRWERFRAWFREIIYDGRPIFTHTPFDQAGL